MPSRVQDARGAKVTETSSWPSETPSSERDYTVSTPIEVPTKGVKGCPGSGPRIKGLLRS